MGFMAGKKALIVGVASDRSIAAGIAEAFAREGAEIAFTYQNEKLKSRVEKLAPPAERFSTSPSSTPSTWSSSSRAIERDVFLSSRKMRLGAEL